MNRLESSSPTLSAAATVAAAPQSIAAAPQPIAAAKIEAVIPVESKSAESNHEEVQEESISSNVKGSPEPEVAEDEAGNVDLVQEEESVDSSSKSGSQIKLRYDYKDGKQDFYLFFNTLSGLYIDADGVKIQEEFFQ